MHMAASVMETCPAPSSVAIILC